MHQNEAEPSPDERRRGIAAVLAAGILRLHTRPEATPETACPVAEDASTQRPDSAQKPLDSGGASSPHVPAG